MGFFSSFFSFVAPFLFGLGAKKLLGGSLFPTPPTPPPAPAAPAALEPPPLPPAPPPPPTAADPAVAAARTRQRQRAGLATGRASTIRTTSLGLLTPATTAKKTLLGV